MTPEALARVLRDIFMAEFLNPAMWPAYEASSSLDRWEKMAAALKALTPAPLERRMDACGAHKKFSEYCSGCAHVRALEAALAALTPAPLPPPPVHGFATSTNTPAPADCNVEARQMKGAVRETTQRPEQTPPPEPK